MTSFLVQLVCFCRRYALGVTLVALLASLGMGYYVANHIKINTDIDQLMAPDLDWRLNEKALDEAFPQTQDRLVIVIDSLDPHNPDLAENAARLLTRELGNRPELFKTVKRPDSIPFFQKNGLLFLSEKKLGALLDVLVKAQPMLGGLAQDPSLRGLFGTLSLALEGVARGQVTYPQIEPSLASVATTLEANLSGRTIAHPWQSMMAAEAPTVRDWRKYIITQPVLDFSSLSPGEKATKLVREIAQQNGLTEANGVKVRLTGPIALNDEEFASVAEGTGMATLLSIGLVILLLFGALKSARLIFPILITLGVGLIATTAFAMAAIGSLNLISVAFAVMFVGIAVDFGIQFGVRFRDEHHKCADVAEAMRSTARLIAGPFCLAAGSTILGFMAFIPTSYRGVSELGLIAGTGMAIAFLLNLTLLPALLSLFKPPAEPEAIAYAWTAPIDRFLSQHRQRLLVVTAIVGLLATITASQIRFDFDPLNLKNPETESVSTLFDIMKDPDASPYTIEILAPSLEEARKLAEKIEKLPEVNHTLTLASFVPEDQETKRAMIEEASFLLTPSLEPINRMPSPSDDDLYQTLSQTSAKLKEMGPQATTAQRLALQLDEIVQRRDSTLLKQLHLSLISGMEDMLKRVALLLAPDHVTVESITPDLRRDWITDDGRAKIEVYPKGNARDPHILEPFTKAVRQIAPHASGAPISIQESGKTVMNAFIQAGLYGLFTISLLGFIVLRKLVDVARLILPLILAGILTLATMVLIHLPLNFANVIALPLLLSLGVSYAIYFITYWKDGNDTLLHSSVARATLFSAGTTLVAFGSLSLSSHPGTSGMGQLLTIALLYSGVSTFFVLPLLLNRLQSVKQK